MRRTAAVLLATAALVAGFVIPAEGATSTVAHQVAVDETTQNGVDMPEVVCSGTAMDAPRRIYMTPASAPADPNAATPVSWTSLGSNPVGSGWGLGLPANDVQPASQFATLKIDVYNGPSGAAVVIAVSINPTTGDVRLFVGKSPIAATGATGQWAVVDASNAVYDWNEYNVSPVSASGPAFKASAGSATLAAFDAAHTAPGVVTLYSPGFAFGCNGEEYAVQHLQWGSAGSAPTVEDLGVLTNPVHIKPSASFITAGSGVSIAGGAQYGAAPTAVLSFKDVAVGTYSTGRTNAYSSTINLLKCNADGTVCDNPFQPILAHPMHNTIYKWTLAGTAGVAGASSGFVMVHVQTKIAPTWPASATHGRGFVVTGSTTPAKPGSVITLWGKRGSSVAKLGSAKIASNGTFRVVGVPTAAGSWTFWLTLPNDSTNAASKSASKGINVG